MLDDIVEALPALRVMPWCAHQPQKFYACELIKFRTKGFKQWQTGKILGRCCIGVKPVGESDPVDDPALDQPALVNFGLELKRSDGDMAAHRLPVNDCPPRLAKPLDELRPQCQQVEQEQVGPVTLAPITRGSPGVTVFR